MKDEKVDELLYQSLETEIGGVEVYKNAVHVAVNEDLKEEWQKYLAETENHVVIVNKVFEQLGLDPTVETSGRQVVRHKGEALVAAMQMAMQAGPPEAASWWRPSVWRTPRPRTMPTGN